MIRVHLRVALRNILKNRRRSLVTISAIALGFAALTLFNGYTTDVFKQLGYSAVVQEGLGHLTVTKRGWLEQGTLHPEKYMLSREEVARIQSTVRAEPGVLLASPKLNVSGLVSNGKVSSIFLAEGTVPADYNTLQRFDPIVTRPGMDTTREDAVQVSEGLMRLLDLKEKSSGVLSAVTLDGAMNAVNFQVERTFNTGVPDTNDKTLRIPLTMAQQLMETDGADRVMVLLDDDARTLVARDALRAKLAAAGLDVDIKTWGERSAFYDGTRNMLRMLLTFMGTIVLVIVIMSVVNTMAVSVLERTREIGTLRVLGLKRRGAHALFAVEGALLGLLGSAGGIVIHTLGWAAIGVARPTYVPPGNSELVLLAVRFVPSFVAVMTVAMILFTLGAAIVPARRAARRNIVDSLGHI